MIRELVRGRDIKLAVNEWNTTFPPPRQHSMEAAVYAARLMNVFERSGDVVQMSSVSDLVNGWPGGIIQASRHKVFVTPTYLVNALYASHLGRDRLSSTLQGPTFDSSLEGKAVPTIDAVVSRSADDKRIFIKAVNTDQANPVTTKISLTGVAIASHAQTETLTSDSLTTANDFSHPDAVHVKASQIGAGPSFTVTLPEHSVSVITLDVEHSPERQNKFGDRRSRERNGH
jgi:alpha-L-arabinofuranosidase